MLKNSLIAVGVIAVTLVFATWLATVTPSSNPGSDCHRQYGYDQALELDCLSKTLNSIKRDNWRATH